MCGHTHLGPDSFEVTILADGTIKIETGKFSGAKHASAEALLRAIEAETGPATRTRIGHTHTHGHEHDHEHEHNCH